MIKPEDLVTGKRTKSTLDHPLEHLMACHRRIEDKLSTIERAAAALEEKPDEALAALQKAFEFFDTNGVRHTEDEEESLFPRLRGRLGSQEAELMAELERQHVEAEALYRQVRSAVGGPSVVLQELAAKLSALYRAHIATEDTRLQAMAAGCLNEDELREIAVEMKRRRGLHS